MIEHWVVWPLWMSDWPMTLIFTQHCSPTEVIFIFVFAHVCAVLCVWYGEEKKTAVIRKRSSANFVSLPKADGHLNSLVWHYAMDFLTFIFYVPRMEPRAFSFYMPVLRRDVLWYGDVSPSGSPAASFPHFSPTCFDIFSWNFAYEFVFLYYRSSSSVVNLR